MIPRQEATLQKKERWSNVRVKCTRALPRGAHGEHGNFYSGETTNDEGIQVFIYISHSAIVVRGCGEQEFLVRNHVFLCFNDTFLRTVLHFFFLNVTRDIFRACLLDR